MPRCKRCRRTSSKWKLVGGLCPECYEEVHIGYSKLPHPDIKLTEEQAHAISELLPGFQANRRSITYEEWSRVKGRYREVNRNGQA